VSADRSYLWNLDDVTGWRSGLDARAYLTQTTLSLDETRDLVAAEGAIPH